MNFDEQLADLRTVSLTQAGELLGIGRNKAYALNRDGEFPVPVYTIAGKHRVRLSHIKHLLSQEQGQEPLITA